MSAMSHLAKLAGAIVLMCVGAVRAQSTSHPTPRPSTQPATRPAVEQPEEFRALAAKVRQRESLHVQCVAVVEMTGEATTRPTTRSTTRGATTRPIATKAEVSFWATSAGWRARTKADGTDASDTILRDGMFYWIQILPPPYGTVAQCAEAPTPSHWVELVGGPGGLLLDAWNGYPLMARGGKLALLSSPPPELRRLAPDAKWFEKEYVGREGPSPVDAGGVAKVALSAEDGLPRALAMEEPVGPDSEGRTFRLTIVYDDVRVGEAEAGDLKFPAEAAKLEWKDMRTGEVVRPPASLFAEADAGEGSGE